MIIMEFRKAKKILGMLKRSQETLVVFPFSNLTRSSLG